MPPFSYLILCATLEYKKYILFQLTRWQLSWFTLFFFAPPSRPTPYILFGTWTSPNPHPHLHPPPHPASLLKKVSGKSLFAVGAFMHRGSQFSPMYSTSKVHRSYLGVVSLHMINSIVFFVLVFFVWVFFFRISVLLFVFISICVVFYDVFIYLMYFSLFVVSDFHAFKISSDLFIETFLSKSS